jgi:hypothetical protein
MAPEAGVPLQGTAAVQVVWMAATGVTEEITMNRKHDDQQSGNRPERHFSDRDADRKQQSQRGAGGRQQGGFPHESGSWGQPPDEDSGSGKGDHNQGGKNNEQGRHTDKGEGL